MDEDIMKAIEQAAAEADAGQEHQERMEIEAYINHVALDIQTLTLAHLYAKPLALPEPTRSKLDAWQKQNKERLAIRVGRVVSVILRKELLGE